MHDYSFLQLFFNTGGAWEHVVAAGQAGTYWYVDVIRAVVRALIGLFAVLLGVPPLVWWERRLLGWMQQRQGPNRVGPFGLLQTIADGVKLLFKEDTNPLAVDKLLFTIAPAIFLIPSLVTPGVIPWGPSPVWGAVAPGISVGVLYLLAWASLAVYGIVMAGWSSNNKYSLLGGLRSSAQMISYELGMGLSILTVALVSGSLDLQKIVERQGYWIWNWNLLWMFPMGFVAFIIYTISMLAETNRAPFDLPEAETELVAGYHTEYTSMKFATFFMGEYANMVITSAINVTLFWGGYHAPIMYLDGSYLGHLVGGIGGAALAVVANVFWLTLKVLAGLYFFIWIRATLPRLRYDMLMTFGWQGILPIALINILIAAFGIALGWGVGAVIWLVVAAIALAAFASSAKSQKFTTATRRNTTLVMNSEAQPYSSNPNHPGRGGQTEPADALSELAASVERREATTSIR